MKKLIFTIFFACISVLIVHAQDSNATKAPGIKFADTIYDFGSIKQNVPVTHDFKFTNTGKAPLIISNAQAACGCTVPEWPQEPIMPGKTRVIKATFNAYNAGHFTKGITITSNAGLVFLNITGEVIADVQTVPQTVPSAK